MLRALHQVSLTDHQPASEPRPVKTHTLTGRLARERTDCSDLVTPVRVAAAALVEAWPEFPSPQLAGTVRSNAPAIEELKSPCPGRRPSSGRITMPP